MKTPRTDAAIDHIIWKKDPDGFVVLGSSRKFVSAEFAQELERELATAQQKIAELDDRCLTLAARATSAKLGLQDARRVHQEEIDSLSDDLEDAKSTADQKSEQARSWEALFDTVYQELQDSYTAADKGIGEGQQSGLQHAVATVKHAAECLRTVKQNNVALRGLAQNLADKLEDTKAALGEVRQTAVVLRCCLGRPPVATRMLAGKVAMIDRTNPERSCVTLSFPPSTDLRHLHTDASVTVEYV